MTKVLPAWKPWLILFFLFLLLATKAQATHLRAGHIYASSDTTSTPVPGRFFFTLVTFSVAPPPFEDLEATLYFGDCTSQRVARSSRVLLANNQNNSFMNIYRFEHVYSGTGTFTVSFVGENRNGGVVNISSSVQQTFFLQATITVDPLLGVNRSPILPYPPLDLAARNQVFVHNPAAFDPDGDSLSYKIVAPRISDGTDPCGNPLGKSAPGYQSPAQFTGSRVTGRSSGFTLDAKTGQLTWNTPGVMGEFNLAMEVEEWRAGCLIGKVTRDMQVFVREDANRPPQITPPLAICAVASTSIQKIINASDEDQHPLTLHALGPMLPPFSSGASFVSAADASGVFTWVPALSDIRSEPYQVLFRAEDQVPLGNLKLVDLQPMSVTVLGPAPVLTAAVRETDASIRVTWQEYTIPNARRLYLYRKIGPSTFTPSTCDRGIPASAGYTLVGHVPAGTTSFVDNNNGQGLDLSQNYSYRLYADFNLPQGGTSVASNELTTGRLTKVSDEIKQQISFYPNPATSVLTVQAPASVKVKAAQVFSQIGQITASLAPQKSPEGWTFDVSHLPEGLYLLRMLTDQGMLVYKLSVKH